MSEFSLGDRVVIRDSPEWGVGVIEEVSCHHRTLPECGTVFVGNRLFAVIANSLIERTPRRGEERLSH